MKHSFSHDLFVVCQTERIDTPQGRYYKVPGDGESKLYRSVTTVLGEYYDTGWLDSWKKRVGEEAANKISVQARNRGNALHKLYEDYLLNKEIDTRKVMPVNLIDFKKVIPILESNITRVHGVELPVYSHSMQLAGTTDFFGEWKGKRAIVDFKTSKKPKKLKDIPSYLTQVTIYSRMIMELYGVDVPTFAIIMTVDNEDPIVFEGNTADYQEEVSKILLRSRNAT